MGEILEIKCHNCSANKKVFVGVGMEFSVTKLYHCPLCDFIKSKTFYDESNPFNVDYKENITIKFEDLINTKQFCSNCKIDKKNCFLNEIHESEIETHRCGYCKKKEQKVNVVGYWD